jgi:hypothetical protein
VFLTNKHYNYFIENGCTYAPVEIAMAFSLEFPINECDHNLDNTFGFHGKTYSDKHKYYCEMIKTF